MDDEIEIQSEDVKGGTVTMRAYQRYDLMSQFQKSIRRS